MEIKTTGEKSDKSQIAIFKLIFLVLFSYHYVYTIKMLNEKKSFVFLKVFFFYQKVFFIMFSLFVKCYYLLLIKTMFLPYCLYFLNVHGPVLKFEFWLCQVPFLWLICFFPCGWSLPLHITKYWWKISWASIIMK